MSILKSFKKAPTCDEIEMSGLQDFLDGAEVHACEYQWLLLEAAADSPGHTWGFIKRGCDAPPYFKPFAKEVKRIRAGYSSHDYIIEMLDGSETFVQGSLIPVIHRGAVYREST